jgi:hypothetical protein
METKQSNVSRLIDIGHDLHITSGPMAPNHTPGYNSYLLYNAILMTNTKSLTDHLAWYQKGHH